MAYQRSDEFSDELLWLADKAKALSHPARLAILDVLARRNVCMCGDIVEELPLAQATVSQHLKVLKEAGLITGTVEGPRTCYCVDWDTLKRAASGLGNWFSGIQSSTFCC
jgi:DNA-binding transcriptional ArsR family regulator